MAARSCTHAWLQEAVHTHPIARSTRPLRYISALVNLRFDAATRFVGRSGRGVGGACLSHEHQPRGSSPTSHGYHGYTEYPHRHIERVVAEFHAAARDGGQERPSGLSGRAPEPGSAALPLGAVEFEALQHVGVACVIPLPPHELLRPKQPVPPVQELRRQVLRCCVPFALLRVPCVEAASPLPHGGATSSLQRAKRSWAPLQVALRLASAGNERSVRDLVSLHVQP